MTVEMLIVITASFLWGWFARWFLSRIDAAMKKPPERKEEYRCSACDVSDCPARDTGVLYPCPYFHAPIGKS